MSKTTLRKLQRQRAQQEQQQQQKTARREQRNLKKTMLLLAGGGALTYSAFKSAADHIHCHASGGQEADPYNAQRGFWYSDSGWLF